MRTTCDPTAPGLRTRRASRPARLDPARRGLAACSRPRAVPSGLRFEERADRRPTAGVGFGGVSGDGVRREPAPASRWLREPVELASPSEACAFVDVGADGHRAAPRRWGRLTKSVAMSVTKLALAEAELTDWKVQSWPFFRSSAAGNSNGPPHYARLEARLGAPYARVMFATPFSVSAGQSDSRGDNATSGILRDVCSWYRP